MMEMVSWFGLDGFVGVGDVDGDGAVVVGGCTWQQKNCRVCLLYCSTFACDFLVPWPLLSLLFDFHIFLYFGIT